MSNIIEKFSEEQQLFIEAEKEEELSKMLRRNAPNLEEVSEKLKSYASLTLSFEQKSREIYVLRCLLEGKILNELKSIVKKEKTEKWEEWREKNLPIYSKRKCQNIMKLGKEKNIDKYAHLGLSSLLIIQSHIDNLYDSKCCDDRLGSFFEESEYPYKSYNNFEKTKEIVPVHTFYVKAKRNNMSLDISLLKDVNRYVEKLDDSLMENLLQHEKTGSANERLRTLIQGRGKNLKLSSTNKQKHKILAFDRIASEMIEICNNYCKNKESIREINNKILKDLILTIQKLEQLAIQEQEGGKS